ncbi:MAG: hypothetical protein KAQ68_08890 [Clostridiales bacterium]|nr:hypothetical protein [Clostridiales bacterium]
MGFRIFGVNLYVKDSFKAVDMYCKAFGAEISQKILDKDNKSYAHCVLFIDGEQFMAIAEAPIDTFFGNKDKWQTMAMNMCLGSKEAVKKAYDILSEGGHVFDGPCPCPWNEYCSNLIDKYGVFWWIAV